MKIKSALVTQMSGSIGGMTGSHNKGGMYLRARTIPVNPNSTQQQLQRQYFSTAVQRWTEVLTEVNRTTWRNYANNVLLTDTLGDALQLSGQQMYIRTATAQMLAASGGATPPTIDTFDTAPATFDTGELGDISFTQATSDNREVTVGIAGAPGWAAQDDGTLILQLGIPQNNSRRFFKGPFRFCDSVNGASLSPITTAVIDADDCTPIINFATGQRMFVRCRALYNDGRLTSSVIVNGIAITA